MNPSRPSRPTRQPHILSVRTTMTYLVPPVLLVLSTMAYTYCWMTESLGGIVVFSFGIGVSFFLVLEQGR